MSFSHRFFLYGPFLLLVAFAASVMLYWWHAADQLSHRLDQMNGREIAPGVHMHFGAKRIAGFPFRLDAILTDLTVDAPGADGPVTWRTHDFASHRLTYDSTKYVLEAAGPQEISWTNDKGEKRSFRFTSSVLHGSATIAGGKLAYFDIDTYGLVSKKFSAARAQFHLRHDPVQDALDVVADLQSVRFAGDAAAGFADGFSHARIEGRLAPAEPFAPVLAGDADWRGALDGWQRGKDSGFKVDQAALFWGKCEATSSGAVALDSEHRLAGSLAFSLADCDALDKQAAGVTEHPGSHRALLDVLAELSHRVPADKTGAVPITVVFKGGLIFVGPGKDVGDSVGFEPVGFLHTLY
jgi:hypothetical protein